jgi:hypothetical protein
MMHKVKLIRLYVEYAYDSYGDYEAITHVASHGLNEWDEIDDKTYKLLVGSKNWLQSQGLVLIEQQPIDETLQEIAARAQKNKEQAAKREATKKANEAKRKEAAKKRAEKKKAKEIEKAKKLLEEEGLQ